MKHYRLACALVLLAFLTIALPAHAQKAKLTSYKAMMTRLASIQTVDSTNGNHRLKLTVIGKSAKGKDIPMVTIADPGMSPEASKRLFIMCRQHGDEPASTEAMLNLASDLVLSTDKDVADLLAKVTFYIVPMVNPDGADAYRRRNAKGSDLNRDWLKLSQPETKAVKSAIDSVNPTVIIDEHELSPGNPGGDFLETAGTTCGAPSEVIAESIRIQNLVVGMLRTHDISVKAYEINDHNPARLAHRYFPVYGGKNTFLFETRQFGVRQYQLAYRMKLHTVGAMTVAKYLAGQEDQLVQRIAEYDSKRWVELASRGKRPAKPATKHKK